MPFWQNVGTASLRKTGSGVLEMAAINTYTGTNTIEAGTLLANNPVSSTGSGSVIVTNTGTLGGTGVVVGAVTVYSGASLAPGAWASVGTLTVSNNVTLKAGAIFNVDLASVSSNDKLVCSNLVMAGYVNPNPLSGYNPPLNTEWTIATITGAGPIDIAGATTTGDYALRVSGASLILSKPSKSTVLFVR